MHAAQRNRQQIAAALAGKLGDVGHLVMLSGFTLALARTVGEYGSVVFISGNLPFKTEIAPLLIVGKLEQYDYAGAAAVAVAMLLISVALLLAANTAQARLSRRGER